MGAAAPYAIAGKVRSSGSAGHRLLGDGAMQMNNMNELITVSKYWKQWSNPRLIVLVLNNRDLNQVTWEERIQLVPARPNRTQSIPDLPYHKFAELIGLKGIFCR